MNRYIKCMFIAIIGIFICLLFNNMFEIPNDNDYVSTMKIIEKIERNEQTIYFTFTDDDVNYSFTEYDETSCEYVLGKVKVGDEILITTEKDIGKFVYTLIHEIYKDGNLIYSSIEYYKNHNHNLKLIFIPTVIIICLYLVISCFLDLEKNNTINYFIIRQPKWIINFFVTFMLLGIFPPIIFTILYISEKMPYRTYEFSYLFYFFLIFGLFGLFTSINQKLIYDGEKYIIFTQFKKKKEVYLVELSYLLIDRVNKGKKSKTGIYNKQGKKIFSISFELLHCLHNRYFLNSMYNKDICFYELIKNQKGETIKRKIKIKGK